jgi:hypothetical protein
MLNPTTIYIDLDETLISALPSRGGMGQSKLRTPIYVKEPKPKENETNRAIKTLLQKMDELDSKPKQKKENKKGDLYFTSLRPIALTILKKCREIAPTKILTVGARSYALTQNKTLKLGFAEHDIIAREDWTQEVHTAYGGKDIYLPEVRIEPSGILIDNNPSNHDWARRKMNFLGITTERYITIREYTGGKDPDKFYGELNGIFEKILGKKLEIPFKKPNKEIEMVM